MYKKLRDVLAKTFLLFFVSFMIFDNCLLSKFLYLCLPPFLIGLMSIFCYKNFCIDPLLIESKTFINVFDLCNIDLNALGITLQSFESSFRSSSLFSLQTIFTPYSRNFSSPDCAMFELVFKQNFKLRNQLQYLFFLN